MNNFDMILDKKFPRITNQYHNVLGESFSSVEEMKIGIIFNEDRTNTPLQIFTILISNRRIDRFNTVVNNESSREIKSVKKLADNQWEALCTYFSYDLQKQIDEKLVLELNGNEITVQVDEVYKTTFQYKSLAEWLCDDLIRNKAFFWSHLSEMIYQALVDYGIISADY